MYVTTIQGKPFLMENKGLLISFSQYHGCSWHGISRSQGISNYDIDLAYL